MNAVLERVAAAPLLSDEDRARAEHYAVFSHLFAAPPDAAFLNSLAALAATWGNADSALGQGWLQLGAAASAVDAVQVEEEYTRLFLTIGRPEVMLFGSYYIAGSSIRKPAM